MDIVDIIRLEQSSFRATRSYADNIFILNTILKFNKNKKLLSLFVDLKEVYDRVDRGILIQKLVQLNILQTFVNFLENYYFQDTRTRPQYQKQGLHARGVAWAMFCLLSNYQNYQEACRIAELVLSFQMELL